ncbi:hypothetical protein TorRG33x02_287800 [Trema orientale]|uniref:Uncharacterized protein n=1 Tax=Trema orientale TaxID=63057 RepID=A0A2P5CEV6_TREOI|nr:hypothetical protein TorRG33x02_287800 [Trema orientale]
MKSKKIQVALTYIREQKSRLKENQHRSTSKDSGSHSCPEGMCFSITQAESKVLRRFNDDNSQFVMLQGPLIVYNAGRLRAY